MKKIKFLIEMKHGLGDCVCMIPVVTAIRQKYPDSYIAMIVNGDSNVEIFNRSRGGNQLFLFFKPEKTATGTNYKNSCCIKTGTF